MEGNIFEKTSSTTASLESKNKLNEEEKSQLLDAIQRGNFDSAVKLLSLMEDVDEIIYSSPYFNKSALIVACEFKRFDIIKYLIEAGANVNKFYGNIPAAIGSLTRLAAINLILNSFTGLIPFEIYSMTNLKQIDLGFNKLVGSIEPDIGLLTKVDFLYLDFNKFTGTIPTEIGLLNGLNQL